MPTGHGCSWRESSWFDYFQKLLTEEFTEVRKDAYACGDRQQFETANQVLWATEKVILPLVLVAGVFVLWKRGTLRRIWEAAGKQEAEDGREDAN